MKYNKKTALFLIVGIAPLWLSACSKSDDTARGEAGAISVSIESDVTPQSRPEVVMYKSPDCECCTGWAEHLRKAGFTVSIHKQDDMDAIKEKFGATRQKKKGVKGLDIAKRLLDYGVHAPTMYFPLIVEEALMVEPTETESKETLDHFIEIMHRIDDEISSNPDLVTSAPHTLPVTRLDEAGAARRPYLRWQADE